MAEIQMDEETTRAFIAKIDMARVALDNKERNIEGYGKGPEAAYLLLCEAQAIAPNNQALADEIQKLRELAQANNPSTQKKSTETQTISNTTEAATPDQLLTISEQKMQQWETQPTIEILVCVDEHQLKGLADTIDSISSQIYSNWKLTVISNMPIPDPVFQQHNILQWIQTDNFQDNLNQAIANSSADWLGLIEAGGCLDSQALFALANQDNLKGDKWQIAYSDEDYIGTNKVLSQPIFKPDFDISQFTDANLIGNFCFARRALLQKIGGLNISVKHSNNDMVLRAARQIDATAIGHIPTILYHRPMNTVTDISENIIQRQVNVA